MRVTLKRRWRALKAGQPAELPDGVANVLIRRGFAEPSGGKRRRPRRSKPYIDSAPEP